MSHFTWGVLWGACFTLAALFVPVLLGATLRAIAEWRYNRNADRWPTWTEWITLEQAALRGAGEDYSVVRDALAKLRDRQFHHAAPPRPAGWRWL